MPTPALDPWGHPLGPLPPVITTVTSADGSVTILNPTGPTVDLSVPPASPNCMDFAGEQSPGGPGPGIDFGVTYPNITIDIGSSMTQGWVKNGTIVTGYFWCTGLGGAHPVLLGVDGAGGVTGNVMGLAGPVSIVAQSCDLVGFNEWFFVQLWYDHIETMITLTINGIVCGRASLAARYTATIPGTWFIAAHSHDEFKGRMSWTQSWDRNVFPSDRDTISFWCQAYRSKGINGSPSGVPINPEVEILCSDLVTHAPDFCWDMSANNGGLVADLAPPPFPIQLYSAARAYILRDEIQDLGVFYFCIQAGAGHTPASSPTFWTAVSGFPALPNNRGAQTHPGRELFMSAVGGILPVRKFDPDYPGSTSSPRVIPNAPTKASYAPPIDLTYKIFDSFGKSQSNWATNTGTNVYPSLGNTESGTLGPLPWQHLALGVSGEFYGAGIRNGNAIYIGVSDTQVRFQGIQYVEISSPNHGCQVRKPVGALGGITGFNAYGPAPVVRFVDKDNCIFMHVNNNQVSLIKRVATIETTIIGVTAIAPGWTSLRLTVSGANLLTMWSGVQVGAGAGVTVWTSLASVTDAANAAGTKCGWTPGYAGSFGRVCEFGAF